MNPNQLLAIDEKKLRIILERSIKDFTQILNSLEKKKNIQSTNLEEEILRKIPVYPNKIKVDKISSSFRKDGIISKFSEMKSVINEMYKQRKIQAIEGTLGGKGKSEINTKSVVFLERPINFIEKQVELPLFIKPEESSSIPSFYRFTRNIDYFIRKIYDFGRRIPIGEIISHSLKKDPSLTRDISIQFLRDLNLLFPKKIRLDPSGENTDVSKTIMISGLYYSHILVIEQLIS